MAHCLLLAPSRLEDEAEDGDVDGSGQKYKTIAELKREEAMQRAGAGFSTRTLFRHVACQDIHDQALHRLG